MRRSVRHDERLAARSENLAKFAYRPVMIIDVIEHPHRQHSIERAVGNRKVDSVCLHHVGASGTLGGWAAAYDIPAERSSPTIGPPARDRVQR